MAHASLALSMTLVGSYVGLSHWLLGVVPVFMLAGLRFGIAAIGLLPWLRRLPAERALRPVDHLRLCTTAFIGTFLFSLCMLQGIAWSGAVSAGVAMALLPGVVAVFARVWLKEAIGRRTLAGIGCTVTGILLATIVGAEGATAPHAWLGLPLLVAAVLCEAAYVVLARQLAQTVSPRRITALVNLWGLLFIAPLALWQWHQVGPPALTALHALALLYYGLAAGVLSVWLWMRGVRQVKAAHAGIFTACLPVTAALVGWAVGEPLQSAKAAALALAVAGVLLASSGRHGAGD